MEEKTHMATGLSIATNLLSNAVQLNLDNNQKQLQNTVTQLSSGLRINTAADDPSGNAIATNLTSQYEAFNQASQNVQNANNAANVALGALTQETNILQRIRTLAVEAASDVNSSSDRANLQAEVSQLLLEVNRISQNTNFNGQSLLNGSHQGDQSGAEAYFTITANAALEAGGFLVQERRDRHGLRHLGQHGRRNDRNPSRREHRQPDGGSARSSKITEFNSQSQVVANTTTLVARGTYTYTTSLNGAGSSTKITFSAPTLGDIGQTAYIKFSQYVAPTNYATAPAFNFQSAADEGDVIQLGIAGDEHEHPAYLEHQPRSELGAKSVARRGRCDRPDRHRAADAQHAASATRCRRRSPRHRPAERRYRRDQPASLGIEHRRPQRGSGDDAVHEASGARPSRYLGAGAVEHQRADGSRAVPLIGLAGNRSSVDLEGPLRRALVAF